MSILVAEYAVIHVAFLTCLLALPLHVYNTDDKAEPCSEDLCDLGERWGEGISSYESSLNNTPELRVNCIDDNVLSQTPFPQALVGHWYHILTEQLHSLCRRHLNLTQRFYCVSCHSQKFRKHHRLKFKQKRLIILIDFHSKLHGDSCKLTLTGSYQIPLYLR